VELLEGSVDYILLDRMNYHYADAIYRKYRLDDKHTDAYFTWAGHRIKSDSDRLEIECTIV